MVQCFSLTTNQRTVLFNLTFQRNQQAWSWLSECPVLQGEARRQGAQFFSRTYALPLYTLTYGVRRKAFRISQATDPSWLKWIMLKKSNSYPLKDFKKIKFFLNCTRGFVAVADWQRTIRRGPPSILGLV